MRAGSPGETSYGVPALEALANAIARAKAGEPLRPVTVVPPSQIAGLHARRWLAGHGGIVNVRFMPQMRLAELLAGERIAADGRAKATPSVCLEAARVAMLDENGLLGQFADAPLAIHAIARTLASLHSRDANALDSLKSAKARSLAAIQRAYLERLHSYRTDEDLLQGAIDSVRHGSPALADVGQVVVWLPRSPNVPQEELLTALAAEVVAGKQKASWEACRFLVGGDADDECRAIARDVARLAAAGTPLYRIGVVWRQRDPYAWLLMRAFGEAGLPVNGAKPRSLAETAPGRCVSLFPKLAARHFRRHEVMEWVATGTTVPAEKAASWNRATRDAFIVRGAASWTSRLSRDADGELRAWFEALTASAEPPRGATWLGWAAWLGAALEAYRGTPRQDPDELERAAVDQALAELSRLDEVGRAPDLASLDLHLGQLLQAPVERVGAYGDGAYLGPIGSCMGLEFDTLYVVGMSDGWYPRAVREDSVLSSAEREAAGIPPDPEAPSTVREREEFVCATSSAPDVCLCLPRSDRRQGRENLPAPWFLDALGGTLGRPCYASDLEALQTEGHPKLIARASFEESLARDRAGSLLERDLQQLLAATDKPGLASDWGRKGLAQGLRMQRARASNDLTPWDGRAANLPPTARYSASGLERWATCPQQYYLSRVLRLEETGEPEEEARLNPLTLGTAVHDALRDFMKERKPASFDQEWSREDRDRLDEIFRGHFRSKFGKADPSASAAVQRTLASLCRRLQSALTFDYDFRIKYRCIPIGFEQDFGKDGDLQLLLTDADQPRQIAVTGRIDRVDLAEDGTQIAIDYKSGRGPGTLKPEDPTHQGRHLQALLYASVLAQADPSPARGTYWPVTEAPEKRKESEIELTQESRAKLGSVVVSIVDGIEAGLFPWQIKACPTCAFERACPAERNALWHRKRTDPLIAGNRLLSGDLKAAAGEEEAE